MIAQIDISRRRALKMAIAMGGIAMAGGSGRAQTPPQPKIEQLAPELDKIISPPTSGIPAPPKRNYRLAWAQDFTILTDYSQLKVSPGDTPIGSNTWYAHTPANLDWFTFIDPVSNYNPFGIGNGFLTIRVAKRGYGDPNNWFGGYSGGLLSSTDRHGAGFTQQYGYFEAAIWCPGGLNTWPAFWLTSTGGAEIDVMEQYGNWGSPPNNAQPDNYVVTWHDWNGEHRTNGAPIRKPGLTQGFHTFGVDIEPDVIIWYYDRVEVWRAPTYDEAKSPFNVMVNLALGGGTYNNAAHNGYDWSLTPNPSDLKVKYVAVWASPNSPNY
jgi:hypothetical protein